MTYKYKRIIIVITDSLGIGEEPRSKDFGDVGVNTLYHASQAIPLVIPNWKKLGISAIAKIQNNPKLNKQIGYSARVEELSNGKDTLTGHWEMMGIFTKNPFATFTDTGFPDELIQKLEKYTDGRKIIGNCAASGTEIIDKYAHEEEKNNRLILYTSADSVLQICGNENNIPIESLYKYCKAARKICSSRADWNIARVIARPYVQENGKYVRTYNRRDYAVAPTSKTVLDNLVKNGIKTISVGKIRDIFDNHGISEHYHSDGDEDGMDITIDLISKKSENELIFTNLVQFDSHYGHRRNPIGYAENINKFDIKLGKLINAMDKNDLLIISSDHGNDPTYKGTDHTREYLPLVIYSPSFKKARKLPMVSSLATIGKIVATNFKIEKPKIGDDIFDLLE